jgi:hypothetical protein
VISLPAIGHLLQSHRSRHHCQPAPVLHLKPAWCTLSADGLQWWKAACQHIVTGPRRKRWRTCTKKSCPQITKGTHRSVLTGILKSDDYVLKLGGRLVYWLPSDRTTCLPVCSLAPAPSGRPFTYPCWEAGGRPARMLGGTRSLLLTRLLLVSGLGMRCSQTKP